MQTTDENAAYSRCADKIYLSIYIGVYSQRREREENSCALRMITVHLQVAGDCAATVEKKSAAFDPQSYHL